jgi:hypothetical protein
MASNYHREADLSEIRKALKRKLAESEATMEFYRRTRNTSAPEFIRLEQAWDAAQKMLSSVVLGEDVEFMKLPGVNRGEV